MPRLSTFASAFTRSRLPTLAVLTGVVALGACFEVPSSEEHAAAAPRPVTPRGDLSAAESATIALFERSRDSVVFISTSRQVFDVWSRNLLDVPRGTGSGFVWDEHGHIVTNYHVIAGASGARVRLADQREVDARLVGVSPLHDLAVLRIELERNPAEPLPIGTSSDLRVGQSVFAIGNPFGLDWTLTTGIISALDRSLTGESGALIRHLIQTDAAINPGNSGGPLLDSSGRLIGVNTAIYSPSGAYAGVGFAVPVDTVNRVVPELIAKGRYTRPTLGIEVDEELNRLIVRQLGVTGVAVLRVEPGSAAEAAGLRGARLDRRSRLVPGDVIVALNGEAVESVPHLLSSLDDYRIGETVRLTVLRDGSRTDVNVVLQAGGQ